MSYSLWRFFINQNNKDSSPVFFYKLIKFVINFPELFLWTHPIVEQINCLKPFLIKSFVKCKKAVLYLYSDGWSLEKCFLVLKCFSFCCLKCSIRCWDRQILWAYQIILWQSPPPPDSCVRLHWNRLTCSDKVASINHLTQLSFNYLNWIMV